ncbi:hypothetical protein KKE60_04985 [Patescibacteria group bacterium]|nr:hypothetical protein [Patescibacteria group bacterium]
MTDNIEQFDIKSFFDSEEIEYLEHGKNVASGWIGISCPFCGDYSNHCGINLKTNLFSCWVCSEKGNIIKLVKEIKKISYKAAQSLLNSHVYTNMYYQPDSNYQSGIDQVIQASKVLIYPRYTLQEIPEIHKKYLISRNFDPDFLKEKYKLKFTHNTGNYRFKIIVPIFINKKDVSWIAVDVIRKGLTAPYIKCPLEMSIVSANNCLYNIDSAKTTAILVEGITDVWRCGDGVIASMTKFITPEQILLLEQKGIKKVFVMYDSDAVNSAKKTANKLSGLFETEVIELSEGDPADLSSEEVSEIRNLLK